MPCRESAQRGREECHLKTDHTAFKDNIPTQPVLDIPYFSGTLEGAVNLSLPFLENRIPLAVFTPGATVAARAARNTGLTTLLKHGDLVLPDGCGCVLAARLSGTPLPARIAGIDFAEALFSEAPPFSRVFLYGAKPGVAERAAARLREKHPDLIFAAADGYGDDPVRRISAFCPHIVCVCLGAEKQERWIEQHKGELGGVLIGLGGSIDVWAGSVRRAPRLLQRTGLEWLYRTVREPRRLPRLFPLPGYFLKCLFLRPCLKRQKKK